MSIRQALASLSASDYLKQRLISHKAHRPHNTPTVQHALPDWQWVLFAWLMMMTSHQLTLGHTVVYFDDKSDKADDSLDGSRWGIDFLPAWQIETVAMALLWLEEVLDGAWEQFGDTLTSLFHQPTTGMADFVHHYCQQISEQIQLNNHTAKTAADTVLFLRWLLRFCYVCHQHKIDSHDKLMGVLAELPLCVDYHHAPTHATALVYYPAHLADINPTNPKPTNTTTTSGLWLYRSWYAEYQLAVHIHRLLSVQANSSDTLSLSHQLNAEQQQAVSAALRYNFCMITGGPGTGKTFTVAQLVLALHQQKTLNLALVAPTGKAAQRMQESLQQAMAGVPIDTTRFEAKTIHRLLGMGDGQPTFDANNPLPYNVVIVDEASMLGATLAYQLCAAIATGAKLILLGDVDQLAAVDAGAVLADLCRIDALGDYHHKLIQSRRFDSSSGIGKLAKAVNQPLPNQAIDSTAHQATFYQNDPHQDKYNQVMAIIDRHQELSWQDSSQLAMSDLYHKLCTGYQRYFVACQAQQANKAIDIGGLFELLGAYRILTASHQGVLGDEAINTAISLAHYRFSSTAHANATNVPLWYHGRVVMITKNNYELGLFNGDMGICLAQDTGFVVFFDGKPVAITTSLLPEQSITTAYAITIHKSQGSEFDEVAICFDDDNHRLLGQELIYTAITRAKKSVQLYTTKTALAHAISRPTVRQTGLPLIFEQLATTKNSLH